MQIDILQQKIAARWSDQFLSQKLALGELTLEVAPEHLHSICLALRDESDFKFEQLIDVCGVDYLHYGLAEWETEEATLTGYSRGVDSVSHQQTAGNVPNPLLPSALHAGAIPASADW